jgi:hypothetical protein
MKNGMVKIGMFLLLVMALGCSNDDSGNTPVDVVKTKYKITRVTITQMPFTKPGSILLWDVTNNPDVYLELVTNNNTIVHDYTASLSNVTIDDIPLPWNLITPYETTNFSDPIYIYVIDNDVDDTPSFNNEVIGSIPFNMMQYTIGSEKYPTTVTQSNMGVTIKLNLTWE